MDFTTYNQVFFILTSGDLLVNKTDLQDFYLNGTYCHGTGTRTSNCVKPQQPTIYLW